MQTVHQYDVSTIDLSSLPFLPIASRFDLPSCPAIYFVLSAKLQRLLYVGKALDLCQRWGGHHRLPLFQDANVIIAWLELPAGTPDADLYELERLCIKRFAPALNNTPVDQVDPLVPEMRVIVTITNPLVIASLSRAIAVEGKTANACINTALERYVSSRTERDKNRETIRTAVEELHDVAAHLTELKI